MTYSPYQQRIIADAARERQEKEVRAAAEKEAEQKRKKEVEERAAKIFRDRESAKEAAIQADIDAKLEPKKQAQRHAWLAAHPGKNDADFERVWREHLCPLALADLESEAQERTRTALLKKGSYRPM